MKGMRVLLCDDSLLALEKLRDTYEDLGCEVIDTARDGESAIAMYRERGDEIDLVSLDLVLPGMDGLEVLAELKRIDPAVQVIILSSIVQPEIVAKARELGALGILAKPFDPEQIVAIAGKVLGVQG